MSDTLVEAWTRFARTGNPNGGLAETWPQYDNQSGRYLDLNSTVSVKTGYWASFFCNRIPRIV